MRVDKEIKGVNWSRKDSYTKLESVTLKADKKGQSKRNRISENVISKVILRAFWR